MRRYLLDPQIIMLATIIGVQVRQILVLRRLLSDLMDAELRDMVDTA